MGHLDKMYDTGRAHKALTESFARDKTERITRFKEWIAESEKRLEEARMRVLTLPQHISQLQEELDELERMELVPLAEMVREVKP